MPENDIEQIMMMRMMERMGKPNRSWIFIFILIALAGFVALVYMGYIDLDELNPFTTKVYVQVGLQKDIWEIAPDPVGIVVCVGNQDCFIYESSGGGLGKWVYRVKFTLGNKEKWKTGDVPRTNIFTVYRKEDVVFGLTEKGSFEVCAELYDEYNTWKGDFGCVQVTI